MKIIYDEPDRVGLFVAKGFPFIGKEGLRNWEIWKAIGVEAESGSLIAGLVLTHYKVHDAELSVFANSPAFLTRRILRELCRYAFDDLGLLRVTARISENNSRSLRLAKGLGFKAEGSRPFGHHDKSTEIMLGMTFRDCPWYEEK